MLCEVGEESDKVIHFFLSVAQLSFNPEQNIEGSKLSPHLWITVTSDSASSDVTGQPDRVDATCIAPCVSPSLARCNTNLVRGQMSTKFNTQLCLNQPGHPLLLSHTKQITKSQKAGVGSLDSTLSLVSLPFSRLLNLLANET